MQSTVTGVRLAKWRNHGPTLKEIYDLNEKADPVHRKLQYIKYPDRSWGHILEKDTESCVPSL